MSSKRWGWPQVVYLAWASLATLASARLFYGYMLQQTGGEWSAPLDDVFIHFDYARATARGYPFQWTEGNGYSSGGTSLLYPLVLAIGYWIGFRGPELMVWAAILACISVLGFLWANTVFWRHLPTPSLTLLPPIFFSIGALCWSLWSGMEVAFFLGAWSVLLATWHLFLQEESPRWVHYAALGLGGVIVVMARPEGATSVAVLGICAALIRWRKKGIRAGLKTLLWAGIPAVLLLLLQAGVNKWMTGESTANGALVKLAYYNPFLTTEEKWADYWFNLRYVFSRLTFHHFGEEPPWGFVPLGFSLFALFDRRTRLPALLLLLTAVTWVLVVATNGQVRWQNERYVMPSVAWLLIASALGLAALISPEREGKAGIALAVVRAFLASFFVVKFWTYERIQYRDQVWFFARASRNIRDQHTTTGRLLRRLDPPPRRVLVGDAGALLYASDLPGFDLIGLGGYHKFPLARAGVQGLPATLELIERLPPRERPDYMAIYPSWWPALPNWFGQQLFSVPVRGNVICGGAEKVVYQADWRLLGTGNRPRNQQPGEILLDELDVADLINEQQHNYRFPTPQGGWTEMRVLPDPESSERDLWDAGRRIPNGRMETFQFTHLLPGKPARLLLRTIVDQRLKLEIEINGRIRTIVLEPTPGWSELAVPVLPEEVTSPLNVSIIPREGEWIHYHSWALSLP